MARISYVNGRFLPHASASVHVEDRGYQFADGVYEVMAIRGGAPANEALHFARLERSLGALRIAAPMSPRALGLVIRELVRRNRLSDGIVYLQVTRGVAPRDHRFPDHVRPSLVLTARRARPPSPEAVDEGVAVIAIPDIRWGRCDVKAIALLPNALGKQQAWEAGAYEAWQIDDAGMVTEGTSTNAWIVTDAGEVVTHPADHAILDGVTRVRLIEIARAAGITVTQRPFSLEEAKAAPEAFLTSTTAAVLPVVQIDDSLVGAGWPGPVTRRLRDLYLVPAAAGPKE
ncbi:MAG: D-amino-acid transaminase [Rhodospirillales bacterium]|nr:D-amino-acid transaminase [Rhodospirillales bacterium]